MDSGSMCSQVIFHDCFQNTDMAYDKRSGGFTPWDEFTYTGQLTTEWSIDASVLRFTDYGNFLMFS